MLDEINTKALSQVRAFVLIRHCFAFGRNPQSFRLLKEIFMKAFVLNQAIIHSKFRFNLNDYIIVEFLFLRPVNLKQTLLVPIALFLGVYVSTAQQDIQYSHFKYRMHAINPAVAGSQDAIPATIFSRNQWMGLNGAPVAQSFDIHTPLYGIEGGAGLIVNNDKSGAIRTSSLTLSFSKLIPVQKSKLFIGLQAGAIQKLIDGDDLRAPEGNYGDIFTHNDAILPNTQVSAIGPDVGFGLYLYNDDYYASASVTHLLETTITLDGYSKMK